MNKIVYFYFRKFRKMEVIHPHKNKIKIISTFYNPGDLIDSCIHSLLTQDYDNYEVIWCDDCSTDGSYNKIPACTYKVDENNQPIKDENGELIILEKHPLLEKTKCLNIQALRASTRGTALVNIWNCILNFCKDPDDIVVLVDADDFLIGKGALSHINDMYNQNPDAWFIYGGSRWSNGQKGCDSEYSEREFNDIKSAPFRISHIRTFRSGLFLKIAEQDPSWSCLKDKNGEFYLSSYDTAMCYPMLQMAGYKHVVHNKKVTYMYNLHDKNDHAVNQKLQWDIHEEVLKKKDFKLIDNYK